MLPAHFSGYLECAPHRENLGWSPSIHPVAASQLSPAYGSSSGSNFCVFCLFSFWGQGKGNWQTMVLPGQNYGEALAGMSCLGGASSRKQKGVCLGCEFGSQLGHMWGDQSVSLSHQFLSLSLSPVSPLSKINNACLQVRIKKKELKGSWWCLWHAQPCSTLYSTPLCVR